jgi:hypothetical protein
MLAILSKHNELVIGMRLGKKSLMIREAYYDYKGNVIDAHKYSFLFRLLSTRYMWMFIESSSMDCIFPVLKKILSTIIYVPQGRSAILCQVDRSNPLD